MFIGYKNMKKITSKAIALHYNGLSTPQITAKGEGEIAKTIIKTALKHGIPIQQDVELTELLAKVELNQEIPPVLYAAVAQILVFIYYLNDKNIVEENI